jgi:hypothetical protein
MSEINWSALGLTGPSSFAAAGPAQTIVVHSDLPSSQTTISGGVILGSPTGPPIADPVLYGTASNFGNVNPDPSLQDSITISFGVSIHNFQVEIFNGISTSTKYEVTDNAGDPPTFISLQPDGATSGSFGFVNLPETNGATTITITPVGTGPWDFFIDNITFNFNKGDEQIPTELSSATTSQVYNLATTISVLGALADSDEVARVKRDNGARDS